jgi:hypothetical protein
MLVMKFSALALFAALLCFAPCALAQGTLNGNHGSAVLSQTSAGLLVFALGPDGARPGDHNGRNGNNGNGHGCGDGWGWDRDGGGGKGCNAVPEGGATLMYLGLAGLCCLAAAIFTIRQREQASGIN